MALRFNEAKARAAGYTDEQIQQMIAQGPPSVMRPQAQTLPQTQSQPQPERGRGLLDLLSIGTSIGGGILGAPLGPAGVIGGSAIGGGVGEFIENLLDRDKGVDVGGVGKEALLSGIGGAGGLGLARLLGGGARGASQGLARGKILKGVPKVSVDRADELAEAAARSTAPRGSDIAKARKYSQEASSLGNQRRQLIEGVSTTIPKSQLTKDLKTNALDLGVLDSTDTKELDILLKRLPKGKGITTSDVLKFKEGLSKTAAPIHKGQIGSARARAAYSLQQSTDNVLTNYLPDEARGAYEVLTKEIGRALPLKEAFTAGAKRGASIPLPFVGRMGLGPLTRPVQATGDMLTRGPGQRSSNLLTQLLGQSGARAFDPGGQNVIEGEVVDSQETPVISPEIDYSRTSQQPSPQEALKLLALSDLFSTGGKNISKINTLIDLFKEEEPSEEDAKVQSLTNSIDLLLQNLEAAGGAQGAGGIIDSLLGRTPGLRSFGGAQEAQVFEDQRRSLIAPLARAISGEVGVLTDKDISRAEGLLPRLSDPPAVAAQKIQDLKFLIEQSGSAGTANSGILHIGDLLQ